MWPSGEEPSSQLEMHSSVWKLWAVCDLECVWVIFWAGPHIRMALAWMCKRLEYLSEKKTKNNSQVVQSCVQASSISIEETPQWELESDCWADLFQTMAGGCCQQSFISPLIGQRNHPARLFDNSRGKINKTTTLLVWMFVGVGRGERSGNRRGERVSR